MKVSGDRGGKARANRRITRDATPRAVIKLHALAVGFTDSSASGSNFAEVP
jgi:hypothetical protein